MSILIYFYACFGLDLCAYSVPQNEPVSGVAIATPCERPKTRQSGNRAVGDTIFVNGAGWVALLEYQH